MFILTFLILDKIRYTQKCINTIINNVSLLKVVEDLYLKPVSKGNKHLYFCDNTPFSTDRKSGGKPFMISTCRRIYKCFYTGKAGNVINFVMHQLKVNKKLAIRFLCLKYKIAEETEVSSYELGEDNFGLPF